MKQIFVVLFLLLCTVNSYSQINVDNNADALSLDDNTIVARTPKGSYITSSSPYVINQIYSMLSVEKALDKELIGCPVYCKVVERIKSNVTGSEGRLVIRPMYVEKKDGTKLSLLPTDIYRRGKNRSNVKFWTSIFIVPLFIPGTGAYVSPYEHIELRLE